jgi:hypothetical protein
VDRPAAPGRRFAEGQGEPFDGDRVRAGEGEETVGQNHAHLDVAGIARRALDDQAATTRENEKLAAGEAVATGGENDPIDRHLAGRTGVPGRV